MELQSVLWAQVGSVIYFLTETVKPTRTPPLLFVFFFSPQTVSIVLHLLSDPRSTDPTEEGDFTPDGVYAHRLRSI